VHLPCPRPFAGGVAGFFEKFALAAKQRVFAHLQLSSGQLDHDLAYGVAKLALQHHTGLIIFALHQRHHHDGTRVNHIFASGQLAIGQAHRVSQGMQKVAFEEFLPLVQVFFEVLVGHG